MFTDEELQVQLQLARGVKLIPPFEERCHWGFHKSSGGPPKLVLTVESEHIAALFRGVQAGALVSLDAVLKAVGGTKPPAASQWMNTRTATLTQITQTGDTTAELHFMEPGTGLSK